MSSGTSIPAGQRAGNGAPQEPRQPASQVQEKTQQVAGQAQEKGQQAAAQAKSKLREQLDQRSSQAADQIDQQVADLRAVGDSLRQQGKDGPARAADRVAEYAEKTGSYLRDKDSDALLSDAEDLARRQPWAVAAGAAALGFAASRFLKASSSKRYSARAVSHGPTTPEAFPARPVASPPAGSAGAVNPMPAGVSTPPRGRSSEM